METRTTDPHDISLSAKGNTDVERETAVVASGSHAPDGVSAAQAASGHEAEEAEEEIEITEAMIKAGARVLYTFADDRHFSTAISVFSRMCEASGRRVRVRTVTARVSQQI
jgi:N-acyl-D-aspartate/D-glutamate deacylase